MQRYILRRVLLLVPLTWAIVTITFLVVNLTPGDPITELVASIGAGPDVAKMLRQQFGLDKPLPVQYIHYLADVFRGDLGRSILTRQPVVNEILVRFPATLQLALASMAVAVIVGLLFGVFSAITRIPALSSFIMLGALIGISMPSFWLGLMLILFFGVRLGWVPVVGGSGLQSLVLPAVTLGLASGALLARLVRGAMLEVIRQDYIRTALAKGLAERVVVIRHALRNALIPIVTVSGIQFGNLLGGSVIVESVFARRGVGQVAVYAIQQRDLPVVLGAVMFFAAIYITVNLLVDISYGFLDPRIRYD